MSLTKEQIFAAKPQLHEVTFEELGGSVFIRPILLIEQSKFVERGKGIEDAGFEEQMKKGTIPLIIDTVVDPETYEPIFSEDDVDQLMNLPGSIVLKLQKEIFKVNGITPDAQDELGKNS